MRLKTPSRKSVALKKPDLERIASAYRDKSVLVTGGAGFVGSHLVERLAELAADVTVLDNFSSGRRENIEHLEDRIRIVEGDVRDDELVESLVRGKSVVFHLAAIPSVDASVRDPVGTNAVNLCASVRLFELCGRLGVDSVVFASSSAVYGAPKELPLSESAPLGPASPYGVQKLACEHYGLVLSRAGGFSFVALRFFNIYGPRQDPDSPYAAVIPRFVAALLAGRPPVIFGDGTQTRDFVYVSDAVAALLLAGGCGASGVFNVASGRSVSVRELADTLIGMIGGKEPVYDEPRPGDIKHSWADISAIRERLGYEPSVVLDAGLARYIEWFRGRM